MKKYKLSTRISAYIAVISGYYICIWNYNERVTITTHNYISASYLCYAFNQRVIDKKQYIII